MAQANLSAAAAVISAFAFGMSASVLAYSAASDLIRSDSIQRNAGVGGLGSRLLLSGFAPFLGAAEALLRFRFVDGCMGRVCDRFELDGRGCSKAGLCSTLLLAAALLLFLGALFGSCFAGLAFAACLLVGVSAWAARGIEAHRELTRESLPEAIRAMGSCFHAGFTLKQTFDQLESELRGPVADLFGRAGDAMETGSSAEEAIDLIRRSQSVPELSFVAVALEVQHKAGGSMRHVLDAACESLKGELELRRSLKVHTAQARLSAQVVTGVTFALIGLLSLLTEGFLDPFFESAAGVFMLLLALLMQCAGVLAVRRILKVEVA